MAKSAFKSIAAVILIQILLLECNAQLINDAQSLDANLTANSSSFVDLVKVGLYQLRDYVQQSLIDAAVHHANKNVETAIGTIKDVVIKQAQDNMAGAITGLKDAAIAHATQGVVNSFKNVENQLTSAKDAAISNVKKEVFNTITNVKETIRGVKDTIFG